MPALAPRRVWSLGLIALSLGCGASPGELYDQGMAAQAHKQAEVAIKDLGAFTDKSCSGGGTDRRCRKAYLILGEVYEGRGAPGRAWAAYESALTFAPHSDDVTVQANVERVRQALGESQQKASTRAPVIIRYRDEVTDEYSPRSVAISLDVEPILTK